MMTAAEHPALASAAWLRSWVTRVTLARRRSASYMRNPTNGTEVHSGLHCSIISRTLSRRAPILCACEGRWPGRLDGQAGEAARGQQEDGILHGVGEEIEHVQEQH